MRITTLPETNGEFAPENGWLEDNMSFRGTPFFEVLGRVTLPSNTYFRWLPLFTICAQVERFYWEVGKNISWFLGSFWRFNKWIQTVLCTRDAKNSYLSFLFLSWIGYRVPPCLSLDDSGKNCESHVANSNIPRWHQHLKKCVSSGAQCACVLAYCFMLSQDVNWYVATAVFSVPMAALMRLGDEGYIVDWFVGAEGNNKSMWSTKGRWLK